MSVCLSMSYTLNVQIGRKLTGKSKDEILKQLLNFFPRDAVVAVQIAYEVIRVTFKDSTSYKRGMEKDGVRLFGMWCPVMGGGPSVTIVHVIDFPFEECDSSIEEVLGPYGKVKTIKKQKFLAMDDIYTGTRLVSLVMKSRPPRDLMIKGYLCRTWYRGQPLVCNLCAVEGHRSANCPNKDKCRRCGEAGHFARGCPKSRVSFAEAVAGSTRMDTDDPRSSDAPHAESSENPAATGWFGRFRSRFSSAPVSGGASGEAVGAIGDVSAASDGSLAEVPPVVSGEAVSGNAPEEVPVVFLGDSPSAGAPAEPAVNSPAAVADPGVTLVSPVSSPDSELLKDNELDQLQSQSILQDLPSPSPAASGAVIDAVEHLPVQSPAGPVVVGDDGGEGQVVESSGSVSDASPSFPPPAASDLVGNHGPIEDHREGGMDVSEVNSSDSVVGVGATSSDRDWVGYDAHDLQRKAGRNKAGRSGESSSRQSPLVGKAPSKIPGRHPLPPVVSGRPGFRRSDGLKH